MTVDVSAQSTTTAPDPTRPKARPLTILVVDDVAETRRMYSGYFQFVGANVLTARDGIEALQVVHQYRPDVVLLDLAMPRMTGLDVLHNLRAHARTRRLPVIALTGQGVDGTRESALEAGADMYLTKPCLPHVVFSLLLQLLRDEKPGGHRPSGR